MPTPTQALSDSPIQNLLFEQIHPVLEQAINIRSVERQMINVEKRPVSGKYYRIDELTGGNFRYEGRPEGGYLPGKNPSGALQDQSATLQTLELRFKRRLMYSSVEFTGPRSSTGSPMTFRMRPSVALPTGMAMGLPVLVTVMPR